MYTGVTMSGDFVSFHVIMKYSRQASLFILARCPARDTLEPSFLENGEADNYAANVNTGEAGQCVITHVHESKPAI